MSNKGKEPSKDDQAQPRVYYDYYVASIPLLKALVWPIVIFILIIVFKQPLNDTLETIPGIISRSSKITIGDLKLEIENKIQTEASPVIKEALSDLSDDAFIRLIQNGADSTHMQWTGLYCETTKEELVAIYSGLDDLEARNLVEITERSFNDCESEWLWRWTDLGSQAYQFVHSSLLSEFIQAWH